MLRINAGLFAGQPLNFAIATGNPRQFLGHDAGNEPITFDEWGRSNLVGPYLQVTATRVAVYSPPFELVSALGKLDRSEKLITSQATAANRLIMLMSVASAPIEIQELPQEMLTNLLNGAQEVWTQSENPSEQWSIMAMLVSALQAVQIRT